MKGRTNNPFGRPAGVPNKITKELRETINDLLNENIEKVRADFDKLQPKDRVRLFADLLQYALPKFQSIDSTFNPKSMEETRKQVNALFPTEEEINEIDL